VNQQNNLINLDPQQVQNLRIFFPYALSKITEAALSRRRFVHYTSADTAMRIIRAEEVWLRNANCMNDFSEIEYGFDCLNHAFKSRRELFKELFDISFDNFSAELEWSFNEWLPHFRADTYIACLSEHEADEDEIGRLSMWRAYGGDSGVAVVMNSTAFLSPSDALGAYTSPVAYLSKEQFLEKFDEVLLNIKSNSVIVNEMGKYAVLNTMLEAFRAAVLCTKHPGFREEREWRIVHSPQYHVSERIRRDIESVGGIPQPVCKIKLENVPSENLIGAAIPDLVDRIIIGPTRYPDVLRAAFVALLGERGVEKPEGRVFSSDIPLRR